MTQNGLTTTTTMKQRKKKTNKIVTAKIHTKHKNSAQILSYTRNETVKHTNIRQMVL